MQHTFQDPTSLTNIYSTQQYINNLFSILKHINTSQSLYNLFTFGSLYSIYSVTRVIMSSIANRSIPAPQRTWFIALSLAWQVVWSAISDVKSIHVQNVTWNIHRYTGFLMFCFVVIISSVVCGFILSIYTYSEWLPHCQLRNLTFQGWSSGIGTLAQLPLNKP